MENFVIWLIRVYQKYLSPLNNFWLVPGHCRFYPTCSEYTVQAIEKYGFLQGSVLGLKRLGRCHPFAKGGFEEVT